MTKSRAIFVAILVGGVSYLVTSLLMTAQFELPAASSEHFPILARFELPRDYGYFIGDAIPLTLVLETASGVVLDLVNLPQKGEKHGLFEIRDLQLTKSVSAEGLKVYRAAYTLQYFGATPLTVRFEPLEILYALAAERATPTAPYSYQSLRTQPVALYIARMGPYQPTPALDIKGPVDDRRTGVIWLSLATGAMFLLTALGGGCRAWHQRWQRHRVAQAAALTPASTALEALRQEGAVWYPTTASVFPGAARLSHLLRQYLHDAYGIPASTLTTAEVAAMLHDKPFYKDILYALERCDALRYQAPVATGVEEQHLWWEAMTLFEKLQKADVP
jgi:hypothetical protein